MAINFYKESDFQEIAYLDEDIWDLPTQLNTLELWVTENQMTLNEGPYVADIGFSVRKNASGGGATLSPSAMKLFAELKITIYFSEY